MSVSHEVFESAMDASINRLLSLEKAHNELEEHVLELANLVMDQQKVLAELTKHLIALAEKEEK
tara:strand:- start:598 stop:789 length:192 start_codon:yes stop_codon:yes gene_type:complete